MATIQYRVYFDGNCATREQLDQIETVTVDQDLTKAWEAHLEIPMCTAEDGTWQGGEQPFAAAFARVRVEVDAGGGSFVPLIDGPVIGSDTQMSTQPGQSSQTVIVRDDSVYLNHKETVARFDEKLDHEVAAELYKRADQIDSKPQIDTTPKPPVGTPVVVQRGTPMQLLRHLARRHGMYAYVLPAPRQGNKSIGLFKKPPVQADGLPTLVLVGASRNVQSFHVERDSLSLANVTTSSLDVADRSVRTATSSFRDLDLLGPDEALANEQDAAARMAAPGLDGVVDPDSLVQGLANRDALVTFFANGSVVAGCYPAALTPCRVVPIKGLERILNGTYLVTKVTHSLTRSEYTQSFELLRNAVSQPAKASPSPSAADIF